MLRKRPVSGPGAIGSISGGDENRPRDLRSHSRCTACGRRRADQRGGDRNSASGRRRLRGTGGRRPHVYRCHIAAFTNEGGQRWSRTTGLVMASIVNTAAFAVGVVAPRLFPLDVAVFAALVFIASMGAVFGATVARCGTMPPTAFLSGVYLTEPESVAASVLLFAVGGLWYAVATMALTPAPRLRGL